MPLFLTSLSSSSPSTILEISFLPQRSTYTVFLLPAFSPICCFRFFCMRTGMDLQAGWEPWIRECVLLSASSSQAKWNLIQLWERFFAKCDFPSSGKIFWSYVSSAPTPGWHRNFISGLKAYVITQVILKAPMVKSHSHHFSGVYTECRIGQNYLVLLQVISVCRNVFVFSLPFF